MKAASLSDLKNELRFQHPAKVVDICIHLAKHKKETKELLTYLLFEADDEPAFILDVKTQVTEQFEMLNQSHVYLSKKTIRKTLRTTNKYIKFSGSRQTEAELLLFFCTMLKKSGVPLAKGTVLGNLYERQIVKIKKAISTLHEDLQHDYLEELKNMHLTAIE